MNYTKEKTEKLTKIFNQGKKNALVFLCWALIGILVGIVVGLVAGGASGAVGCIVVAIMNIIHYSGALALAQIGVALMGIGVCSLMAFGGLCFGKFVCKGLEKIFGSFKGIGEWFYEE